MKSIVNIEVSPATIEILVTVGQIHLLLCQVFQRGLSGGIIRAGLIEPRDGAESIGMTPGIVGSGAIGTAQFRQLLEGPFFAQRDGLFHLGSLIVCID